MNPANYTDTDDLSDRNAALLQAAGYLFRFARRLARPGDAWDVFQESAVEFLNYHHWFDCDPSHLKRYSWYVVGRAAKRLYGKDSRGRRRAVPGPLPAGLRCPRDGADAVAERAEDLTRVRAVLALLPPADRDVLGRRFGLGGRDRETLDALDPAVTREANRQRVERALGRAAELLNDLRACPRLAPYLVG